MLDEEVSSDGEKHVILSRSMSTKLVECGISSSKLASSKLERNHSRLLLRITSQFESRYRIDAGVLICHLLQYERPIVS